MLKFNGKTRNSNLGQCVFFGGASGVILYPSVMSVLNNVNHHYIFMFHKKYVLGGHWFSTPPSLGPNQFYSTVVLRAQTIQFLTASQKIGTIDINSRNRRPSGPVRPMTLGLPQKWEPEGYFFRFRGSSS